MIERPILFSAPMVRALLSGTKTQTRRPLKPQPPAGTLQVSTFHHPDPRPHFYAWTDDGLGRAGLAGGGWCKPCPYGQAGNRLWVREAFMHEPADYCWEASVSIPCRPASTAYRADHEGDARGAGWTPSIHMPRHLSRITLEITDVLVERLHAISEADAIAEGCHGPDADTGSTLPNCPQCGGVGLYTAFNPGTGGALPDTDCELCDTPVKRYRLLWEAINGAGSWEANPWVWVVSFRRLDG